MEWVSYVIVGGIMILMGVGILAFLAKMLLGVRGWRWRRAGPYVPIEDPHPAAPVTLSAGAIATASLVVLWSTLHLGVAAWWAATGYLVPRKFVWVSAAVYACFAALVSGIGGMLLFGRRAFGRKMVAWGEFLMGMMGCLMLAVALMVPSDPRSPEPLREIGYYLAGVFAIHMVIDVALGASAQRAGRPKGFSEGSAEVGEQETPVLQDPLD